MERAAIVLSDAAFDRWTLPELATWINEGRKRIILAKPSAHSETVELSLATGTHQTVSQSALATGNTPLRIIDVTRNRTNKANGSQGRIITAVSRNALDAEEPNWHDKSYVRFRTEVRHIVFDEDNPLEYFCYPGNDGTGAIEAVMSTLPPDIVASGDVNTPASYATELDLQEVYDGVVLDYVLHRAFLKDDLAGNPVRAMQHLQMFAAAIDLKIRIEGATTPNRKRTEP